MEYINGGTESLMKIREKKLKIKIIKGENMVKRYIKNVTDDKSFGYSPATLAFKEGGKTVVLKPGETAETKSDGSNLAGRTVNGKKEFKRLRLITEEEIGKKKKKEKGE